MIDIAKILNRSWHILWSYRILWLFGILLALTTGGNGGSNAGGSNSGYRFNGANGFNVVTPSTNPTVIQLNNWFQQNIEPLFIHPDQHIATFVWIGVAVFLFILIVSLLVALIHYPTETAVIRMVDEYEVSGTKLGFRKGWKLGWNRRAFRIWVIDLVISLPAFLFVALLLGLGLLIFFSVRNGQGLGIAAGVIAGIGIAFLFIFLFIILMVFLGLLRQFFIREAALEEAGIGASFRLGWEMFKRNWKNAGLMWLVMLGIGIGIGILGLIVFFLLIPVYIVLAIPAVIAAAIPGLVVFGIASLITGGPLSWIIGLVAAAPFFFLVAFAPLTLFNGWYRIYSSSVWTLTYRELKTLESIPAAHPQEQAKLP